MWGSLKNIVPAAEYTWLCTLSHTMEASIDTTTLWQNRKCLLLCSLVSMANLQYGFDLAAVGSLQAMPGFLKVFGYADPSAEGGYAIDVCPTYPTLPYKANYM